jgi:hypothetical protein
MQIYETKDETNEKASIFGKKRKKFKNADVKNLGFLIKMSIISIYIEAFFVLNYILANN